MDSIAWMWMLLGMTLIILELIVPSFVALFFGVAAIVVGAIVLISPNMNLGTQGIIFSILAILFIFLFFKFIKPKLKNRKSIPFDNQIGVLVASHSDGKTGVIRFAIPVQNQEEWEVMANEDLEVNSRYKAIKFDEINNKLIVVKL